MKLTFTDPADLVQQRAGARNDHHPLRLGNCASDERKLRAKLRKIAAERGVNVRIAHDGMEKVLR